ncbi:hypothetical protein Tco_0541038 [Tanacetum coccineum]
MNRATVLVKPYQHREYALDACPRERCRKYLNLGGRAHPSPVLDLDLEGLSTHPTSQEHVLGSFKTQILRIPIDLENMRGNVIVDALQMPAEVRIDSVQ